MIGSAIIAALIVGAYVLLRWARAELERSEAQASVDRAARVFEEAAERNARSRVKPL